MGEAAARPPDSGDRQQPYHCRVTLGLKFLLYKGVEPSTNFVKSTHGIFSTGPSAWLALYGNGL